MDHATVTGLPDEILALLTEPDAIALWTPAPFELIDLDTDRLVAGSRARVRGRLAGRTLVSSTSKSSPRTTSGLRSSPAVQSRSTSSTHCAPPPEEATCAPPNRCAAAA